MYRLHSESDRRVWRRLVAARWIDICTFIRAEVGAVGAVDIGIAPLWLRPTVPIAIERKLAVVERCAGVDTPAPDGRMYYPADLLVDCLQGLAILRDAESIDYRPLFAALGETWPAAT